ncbi:MAG: hypothetical protein U0R71_12290 [Solirubrobacterales bacterium]
MASGSAETSGEAPPRRLPDAPPPPSAERDREPDAAAAGNRRRLRDDRLFGDVLALKRRLARHRAK